MGEMRKPLRILLADDHPFVREGIRSFLAELPEFHVVAEATTGTEAIELTAAHSPDILLLDINMPGVNGIDAIKTLRKTHPATRVLVLTVHNTKEYVLQVAKAGAHGYLLKDAPPEELLQAIKVIQGGGRYYSPTVVGYLAAQLEPASPDRLHLTERETQVLILVARGKTIKEMAEELQITPSTVQTYRVRVMEKLGIHNVAGLTRYALQQRLLPLE